jgi:hypothetical protein
MRRLFAIGIFLLVCVVLGLLIWKSQSGTDDKPRHGDSALARPEAIFVVGTSSKKLQNNGLTFDVRIYPKSDQVDLEIFGGLETPEDARTMDAPETGKMIELAKKLDMCQGHQYPPPAVANRQYVVKSVCDDGSTWQTTIGMDKTTLARMTPPERDFAERIDHLTQTAAGYLNEAVLREAGISGES